MFNEKEYRKRYRMANKEYFKEYDKKYRVAHPEKIKGIYKKSSLKCAEHKKEYYLVNRDKILKYKREYYLTHKDKFKELGKVYHLKNRDLILEKQKKHYLTHENLYKEYHYKKAYGVNIDFLLDMLKKQNGQCAICLHEISMDVKRTDESRAFVDHNHQSGQLRKLLCRHCNSAIGNFKEDLSVMNNAVNYLYSFAGGGE